MSQLGLSMTVEQGAPPRRGRGNVAVVLAGLIMLAIVGGIVLAGIRLFDKSPDYPGPGTGSVVIQIHTGDTLNQIGGILAKAGVVRSGDTFVAVATGDVRANTIGPGSYKMRLQMSAAGAFALLLNPATRVSARVTIPEGTRAVNVAKLLAKGSKLSQVSLLAALKPPAAIGLPAYANGNPEGFLYPATYDIDPSTTAAAMLGIMVKRYQAEAAAIDLDAKARAMGFTPYQVLIVASIVQAEGRPDDFGKLARVIYNRLAKGMRLQLDSTVNYALGLSTLDLTSTQLAVSSPYNTYLVSGLPPGPIDSPGEAALSAALAPTAGNWLYYVTVNRATGQTMFTNSYPEFLKLKAQARANGA